MKKSIFIVLTFLAVLSGSSSCTKFLTEDPTTSFSETSAYATEESLDANIYGIMSLFHDKALWQGNMSEYLQIASGLMGWKVLTTSSFKRDAMKLGKYSTSTYGNTEIFDALFSIINRCNRLLDNLPASPVEPAYKAEIEGEAKFYRALAYYTAVRLWGDVPLILTSPKSAAETSHPRTAWYKVYMQVLDDFIFAEKNMRDNARAETMAPGKGRPCNLAATAFKAEVYLTIGSLLSSPSDNFWDSSKDAGLIAAGKAPRTPDFSACGIKTAADAFKFAYDASESVIGSKVFELAPDYRLLFRWTEPSDWELKERIFVLQSTNNAGVNYCAPYSLPPYPGGTACVSTANTNYGRIRPDRFYYDMFVRLTGGTKGTETYTKDFYVTSVDPRCAATFITRWYNQNGEFYSSTYPSNWYVNNVQDQYAQPYFRKYLSPEYNVNYTRADTYLMRFAEMYLISAEAAANLSTGKGDQWWDIAFDRIEVLHKRARQSHDAGQDDTAFPKWNKDDYDSPVDLADAVIWERFVEMAFEGHEYFDTHRKGATWLRDNISTPKNNYLMLQYSANFWKSLYDYTVYPTEISDLRRSLLCAYPDTEFRLNTQITLKDQNDYFWE